MTKKLTQKLTIRLTQEDKVAYQRLTPGSKALLIKSFRNLLKTLDESDKVTYNEDMNATERTS